MKVIRKIQQLVPDFHQKRVAAYARVSVDTDKTEKSFSTQVSYFSNLIQSNPEWTFAGVYSDLGISGTNVKKRHGFQQMIADADAGKIDIILTKSIQRFARNTVDLLNTIRHLKDLGVEVRFEKERINTLSGDGELMLTILASFAQAESLNMSANIRWTFRKKNEQGIPNQHFFVYGYRWKGDVLVPFPPEAEVIKKIYKDFLEGKSLQKIADELKASGVKTFYGKPTFYKRSIANMLQNNVYTGELVLQKGFTLDPLTKQRKKNEGERPKYLVPEDHEAIVDKDTFDKVQKLIAEKREKGIWANKALHLTCFSGRIKDPYTMKSYRRHPRVNGAIYWEGQDKGQGSIREKTLKKICAEVLGLDAFDEEKFLKQIERIEIPVYHTLRFVFYDGRTIIRNWEDISPKEYWTEEKKQLVKERNRKRHKYPLSNMLLCEQCGYYLTHGFTSRARISHWYCRQCRGYMTEKFSEEKLERQIAEHLKIAQFDENTFRQRIDHIKVRPDGRMNYISKGENK